MQTLKLSGEVYMPPRHKNTRLGEYTQILLKVPFVHPYPEIKTYDENYSAFFKVRFIQKVAEKADQMLFQGAFVKDMIGAFATYDYTRKNFKASAYHIVAARADFSHASDDAKDHPRLNKGVFAGRLVDKIESMEENGHLKATFKLKVKPNVKPECEGDWDAYIPAWAYDDVAEDLLTNRKLHDIIDYCEGPLQTISLRSGGRTVYIFRCIATDIKY